MTTVRPLADGDRAWVRGFMLERWGDEIVVAHGVVHRPANLPGIVVTDEEGHVAGLLTYEIGDGACEVVTVDAVVPGRGYGSLLVDAVADVARQAGCSRVRLITTNDNTRAIGFYRARGFEVVAVWEGAIEGSRKRKPSIPLVNEDGVPIRDEIEMELRLSPSADG